MMQTNKLFKKVNKQWRYYPFGYAIDDVYLIVKDGLKRDFENALNAEWNLYLMIPVFIFSMILFQYSLLLASIPFLTYTAYFFYNRFQMEKTFCHYRQYPRRRFFTAYGRMVYFFLDETDNHQFRMFLFGFILAFFSACVGFAKYKNDFIVGLGFLAALVFLALFILVMIKRVKRGYKYETDELPGEVFKFLGIFLIAYVLIFSGQLEILMEERLESIGIELWN